jgi:hypothetical protein
MAATIQVSAGVTLYKEVIGNVTIELEAHGDGTGYMTTVGTDSSRSVRLLYTPKDVADAVDTYSCLVSVLKTAILPAKGS